MSVAVDVLALGLASPLGLSSRATIAALRAGFVAHEEIDDVIGLDGEPVVACRLEEEIAENAGRLERAAYFAHCALLELIAQRRWTEMPAVFLAGPEAEDDELDPGRIWEELRRKVGASSLPPAASIHNHGRAGGFAALASAVEHLVRDQVDFALVGGADSLVTDAHLRQLAASNRLLSGRNGDGLILGEGAAFCLLARHPCPGAIATIESVALGREAEPRTSAGPSRGTGLSACFAELRRRDAARVQVVVSAQPHQGWWTREFTYAYLRNAALMPEPLTVDLPAAALGDLGCAAGSCALGTAICSFHPLVARKGIVSRSRALVYGSADNGDLGACLLRCPQ